MGQYFFDQPALPWHRQPVVVILHPHADRRGPGQALTCTDCSICIQQRLKLDELVSRRITLEEINAAFDWLEKGAVARSVILY